MMNDKNTITPLSPKKIEGEELERIKPYLEQLKSAIKTDGVYNIALSGGYGSGKSSILKTFQYLDKDTRKRNFLNVSLASFNKVNEESHVEGENNLERILEISILQQIFYHTKPYNRYT